MTLIEKYSHEKKKTFTIKQGNYCIMKENLQDPGVYQSPLCIEKSITT